MLYEDIIGEVRKSSLQVEAAASLKSSVSIFSALIAQISVPDKSNFRFKSGISVLTMRVILSDSCFNRGVGAGAYRDGVVQAIAGKTWTG